MAPEHRPCHEAIWRFPSCYGSITTVTETTVQSGWKRWESSGPAGTVVIPRSRGPVSSRPRLVNPEVRPPRVSTLGSRIRFCTNWRIVSAVSKSVLANTRSVSARAAACSPNEILLGFLAGEHPEFVHSLGHSSPR